MADPKKQPTSSTSNRTETRSTRATHNEPTEAVADPTAVAPGTEPETKTGTEDGHDGSPEAG